MTLAKASIQPRERKDGSKAYRVMFRIDGKQVGETFDTMDGAETFRGWVEKFGGREARELREQRSGQHKATVTVAEMCREHVEGLSGITDGTRQRYRDIIERTIDAQAIGKMPVDAVQRKHVSAWIQAQEKTEVAGKTIKNRHALLSASFSTAVVEGVRESNPCANTRIGMSETRALTFLTHNEFAILVHHMPVRWRPLTVVLAGTGMRFSEAAALQVKDVHLDDDQPVMRIERSWKYINGSERQLGPPKTRKGRRTISLSPNLVRTLRPLLDGKGANDFVFTTAGGQPARNVDYREDGWVRGVRSATAKTRKDGSEIPVTERLTKQPRIHDLRHTHASWLIADGNPLTEIQHRLGHESIKTTSDTYGHLLPEAHARAANTIEIALAQALPELEESE